MLLPDGAFAGVGHLGPYRYVHPTGRHVAVPLGSGQGALRPAAGLALRPQRADGR